VSKLKYEEKVYTIYTKKDKKQRIIKTLSREYSQKNSRIFLWYVTN